MNRTHDTHNKTRESPRASLILHNSKALRILLTWQPFRIIPTTAAPKIIPIKAASKILLNTWGPQNPSDTATHENPLQHSSSLRILLKGQSLRILSTASTQILHNRIFSNTTGPQRPSQHNSFWESSKTQQSLKLFWTWRYSESFSTWKPIRTLPKQAMPQKLSQHSST